MLCALLQLFPSEVVPDWDQSWLLPESRERVRPPEAVWSQIPLPLHPEVALVPRDWLVPWE